MKKLQIIILILVVLLAAGCCDLDKSGTAVSGPPDTVVIENISILDYWDDDKDPQRRLAAIILGSAKHPAAVDTINAHLVKDRDPQVRANCAWAAGRIGDSKSLPLLKKATQDSSPLVRREAILALGKYSDGTAHSRLREILKKNGGIDSLTAAMALGMNAGTLYGLKSTRTTTRGHGETNTGSKYYVDATDGDDANDGSIDKPFRTMAKGISKLRPYGGGVVFATSGKKRMPFREKVEIGPGQIGAPAAPTIIRDWPGKPAPMVYASESVSLENSDDLLASAAIGQRVLAVFIINKKGATIIDQAESLEKMTEGSFFYNEAEKQLLVLPPKGGFGKGAKIEAGVRDDGIIVRDAPYVHIYGFTVAYAQDTGIDFASSPHGFVSNVKVHDCDRHGIFFYYSPFGTVAGSEVSRCRYQGISLRSSPNTTVNECVCTDNAHDGVLFLYDSTGGVVSNSVLKRNGRGVGFITGSILGRVFGSTFKDNKVDVNWDRQSGAVYLPAGD